MHIARLTECVSWDQAGPNAGDCLGHGLWPWAQSPTSPAGWVPTGAEEESETQSSEGDREEGFCEIP